MKHAAAAIAIVLTATPAYAQLSAIKKAIGQAEDAKKKVDEVQKKTDTLSISEKEERRIGEAVSQKLCEDFGVVQDRAVTRYVTLVGTVLAQASARPDLKWEFIVLDTDGVNAFASPGGLVHITRGALGLIKSEAELAGVLGHEITHVTRRHTKTAIEKGARIGAIAKYTPGTSEYFKTVSDAFYQNIVENSFDRADEQESDRDAVRLANKVGYNPAGLGTFLAKLAERNTGKAERNGLFASHPETKSRIDRLANQIRAEQLNATATAGARYPAAIKYEAVPLSAIVPAVAGAKGVAGDGKAAAKEPPKKGFGLGPLKLSTGKQAESTQASASAGNRAVGEDRAAPGGPVKTKVPVTVTPAEVAEFRKGIV